MNIEKQLAEAVRNMTDKKLAEMALQMGFSLTIKPPGKPTGVRKRAAELEAKGFSKAVASLGAKAAANGAAKTTRRRRSKGVGDLGHWPAVLSCLQKNNKGMSSTEICSLTGLTKPVVVKALKQLVEEKKVHRAGDKRFTRYGITKKSANDASVASRG